MEHDRPRWRIRLSTLMLLVIIAALATTLVYERWKREVEARRREAVLARALAEANEANAALTARALAEADEANAALMETQRTQASNRPTPSAPQQGRPNPTREPEAGVP